MARVSGVDTPATTAVAQPTAVVRPAAAGEEDTLVQLGLATGLFTPEEADALLGSSLRGVLDGSSGGVARVVDGPGGGPAGWYYLSADPSGPPHVWELWWIGVSRADEGRGYGRMLLADAEAVAAAAGARLLLISTSSSPATARARAFYERQGYAPAGRIPGYYGEGEDKVVFHKPLAQAAAPT